MAFFPSRSAVLARSFACVPGRNRGNDPRRPQRRPLLPPLRPTASGSPRKSQGKSRRPARPYQAVTMMPVSARPGTTAEQRPPATGPDHPIPPPVAEARSLGPSSVPLHPQQGPAQRQPLTTVAVGQKPVPPNPHETCGYDVQGEPADEFHCVQRHLLAPATVGVVLPGESDAVVLEPHQTVIAQGDPMRVASQILQHLFRTAKWFLGVDHPFLVVQPTNDRSPGGGARQGQRATSELKLTGLVGRAKAARYLPRKTRPRTSTDKNQLGRQDTQCGATAARTLGVSPVALAGTANPPPGTTQ